MFDSSRGVRIFWSADLLVRRSTSLRTSVDETGAADGDELNLSWEQTGRAAARLKLEELMLMR